MLKNICRLWWAPFIICVVVLVGVFASPSPCTGSRTPFLKELNEAELKRFERMKALALKPQPGWEIVSTEARKRVVVLGCEVYGPSISQGYKSINGARFSITLRADWPGDEKERKQVNALKAAQGELIKSDTISNLTLDQYYQLIQGYPAVLLVSSYPDAVFYAYTIDLLFANVVMTVGATHVPIAKFWELVNGYDIAAIASIP